MENNRGFVGWGKKREKKKVIHRVASSVRAAIVEPSCCGGGGWVGCVHCLSRTTGVAVRVVSLRLDIHAQWRGGEGGEGEQELLQRHLKGSPRPSLVR